MDRKRITKVIIGVVVIGTAAAYLLQEAIESPWAYYYSVDEFVESTSGQISKSGGESPKLDKNRIIRLAG